MFSLLISVAVGCSERKKTLSKARTDPVTADRATSMAFRRFMALAAALSTDDNKARSDSNASAQLIPAVVRELLLLLLLWLLFCRNVFCAIRALAVDTFRCCNSRNTNPNRFFIVCSSATPTLLNMENDPCSFSSV